MDSGGLDTHKKRCHSLDPNKKHCHSLDPNKQAYVSSWPRGRWTQALVGSGGACWMGRTWEVSVHGAGAVKSPSHMGPPRSPRCLWGW